MFLPESPKFHRFALGALLTLSACKPPEQAASKPLDVTVYEVQPHDVTITTDFVGTVDGVENAEIRARVAGYLQEVHYNGGTHVKTGQMLFTIDPVLSQAEVLKANGDLAMSRADAAKAKADVERLTPLVATSAVSRQELDHAIAAKQAAEAQVQAAEGNLASARASLDYTKVKSPIDGIAGVREVSVGSLVGQGEPTLLTTISRIDVVKVRFPIPEQLYLKHAALLNRLTEVPEADRPHRLRLILVDGSEYPELGWVSMIDRAVKGGTGAILVEARFSNPQNLLRPGQFARVRTPVDTRTGALTVPQRAVIERQGTYELFVLVAGNKVERRPVVAGARVGSDWVIDKGLKPGEKVLLDGLQKVKADSVVVPHAPAKAQG
ncbi:MAG TPA: efflux RND transporter periplasmic adaptor subunit [Polyangiaceae bacterium]|nr:efflux RND transporter periplasmic adaptor subunit [Polyangiaceae bacterium]